MSPTRTTVRRHYLAYGGPIGSPPQGALVTDTPHHARLTSLPPEVPAWRALYRLVGDAWHWHDRDAWSDERLAAHLARPAVRVFTVRCAIDGTPLDHAGLVELERHDDGSVEIAYLGLAAPAIGRGLGRWLVHAAVAEAQHLGTTRIWLHTCTLDHPAALRNYEQCGFRIEREEQYEVDI